MNTMPFADQIKQVMTFIGVAAAYLFSGEGALYFFTGAAWGINTLHPQPRQLFSIGVSPKMEKGMDSGSLSFILFPAAGTAGICHDRFAGKTGIF